MVSDSNGKLVVPVWSDSGVVKPVINDDGRVSVSIGESSVTLETGIRTWDLTNWNKQATLLGFTSRSLQNISVVSVGAGPFNINSSQIATGWVYVFTGVAVMHTIAVASDVMIRARSGPNYYVFHVFPAVPINAWRGDQINCVLQAGDRLDAMSTATAAAETLTMNLVAYRMKVDE